MTTIMGYWKNDMAWLAADRSVVGGDNHLMPASTNKIVTKKESYEIFGKHKTRHDALGLCGVHAACLIVQEVFRDCTKEMKVFDVAQAMVRGVQGYAVKDLHFSGIMLWNKRMYDVDTKGAITEIQEGVLWARGSGEDYAMGAAHVIFNAAQERYAEIDMGAALEMIYDAVSAHDLYTGGGLQIVEFNIADD